MTSNTLERPAKVVKEKDIHPKVERSGVSQMFYLEEDVAACLEKFISDQEFTPTKTRIFTAAVKDFLRARGYYPPKS